MERVEIIQKYIDTFRNSMHEIESLEEFYYRSLKTYVDYFNQVTKTFEIGITICNLFDSVLEKESIEEKNIRIDEILGEKLNENLYLKDVCKIVYFTENKNSLRYAMIEKYHSDFKYSPSLARTKMDNASKYKKILVESVISHIIVIFENFLGDILGTLIKKDPIKYLANQEILVSDFIQKGQEAITEKIEQTVDAHLRCSIDLLSEISKKEKIEIDRYEKIVKPFTEVYYRRNAYIHTDGKVNKDYMNKVDKDYTKITKIGEILVCNKEYIDNSIILLLKMIFSIIFELLKNENVNADEIRYITDYFFVRLLNKNYAISKFVYKSLSQYNSFEFVDRMNFKINHLNACKQLGEIEFINRELKKLDVSAMHERYIIAKYCLANETEKIYDLLNRTYPNSFDALEIRDWPIFINFRETDKYKIFRNEHLEDFLVDEITADDNFPQQDVDTNNLEDLIEKQDTE